MASFSLPGLRRGVPITRDVIYAMARETAPAPDGQSRPAGWAPVNGPHLWAAGVGGGVGTTTVSALLGVIDTGVWRDGTLVNLLVCSPTSSSTAAAERIIGQRLSSVGARPVLAVVSDGHALPPDSRARLTTLAPLCAGLVHVPFVAGWRTITQPLDWAGEYPRQLAEALAELRLTLDTVSTAPPPPGPPSAAARPVSTGPVSTSSPVPTLPPSWRPPAAAAASPAAASAVPPAGRGPAGSVPRVSAADVSASRAGQERAC